MIRLVFVSNAKIGCPSPTLQKSPIELFYVLIDKTHILLLFFVFLSWI